jgi:hypothetical protein
MTKRKFRSILEEILATPAGTLRDEDTRQTVGAWTSLADVQIIVIVASELGLGDDAEMLDYDTVGELLSALDQRGAFA